MTHRSLEVHKLCPKRSGTQTKTCASDHVEKRNWRNGFKCWNQPKMAATAVVSEGFRCAQSEVVDTLFVRGLCQAPSRFRKRSRARAEDRHQSPSLVAMSLSHSASGINYIE